MNQLTIQSAQVVGFAAGGALIRLIGPRDALLVNALSFLVSAALVRFGVRVHGVIASVQLGNSWERMKTGAKVCFGAPRLRGLVLLGWLATFWVVPEGLAAPYAEGDSHPIRLLLASHPIGSLCAGGVSA